MVLDNIRRKCSECGITLATLEKETEIGNGVIAKWAHGSPRIVNVKKVADYFGCTIDELMSE